MESPLFDKLLVMLGNFHIELAFFGAIGTFLSECGIEFLLSESGTLAEGSMMGFVIGKFYNRCTRIHQLLANVLEQKIYNCFIAELPVEQYELFKDTMRSVPSDVCQVDAYLTDTVITDHLTKYEEFLQKMVEGSHGPTAQYWALYVYLINRLHQELRRCVKTNNVTGYISVLPAVLEVFFGLNRPNYARWGSLFLQKLESAPFGVRQLLDMGAFSVRRTGKAYSHSAVDLSLEQTCQSRCSITVQGCSCISEFSNGPLQWHSGLWQLLN